MRRLLPSLGAVCLLALAQTANAQPPAAPSGEVDVLSIGASDAVGNEGRVAVNAAAGNNNQQANGAVMALGGLAIGSGHVLQSATTVPQSRPLHAAASIEGHAFAGSSGMIGVNAVAGSDNQAANLAVFAIGIGIEGKALADTMLSQTRSSQQPTGDPVQAVSSNTLATVSDGAFSGSSGLVQVNLIGGERNSSANLFALTTIGDAEP